jgi:hypothetical protein
MTTLKGVKLASTVAALKAERERDKVQAVRDYGEENRARQANMARLRALRLAKERADSQAITVPRSTKKKNKNAATQTGSAIT